MAAGLSDMEGLIERIADPEITGFMREAFTCYGAGAYRACVVLSFIAVFEDLRQKVKSASVLNKDAKTISTAIELLANGQKPFETDLVNRLASKSLIDKIQSQRLVQLIDHRNKAAHPSGHHASAEEARFVFFESIDRFLSQPLLSAEKFADAILDRLSDSLYFPDGTITNLKPIVDGELKTLNPVAFEYLISRLVTKLTDGDVAIAKNSMWFLVGVAALKRDDLRVILDRQFIQKKASSPDYARSIASVLSVDAQLILSDDVVTRSRLNALLTALVESTDWTVQVLHLNHPIAVMKSMSGLSPNEIVPNFQPFLSAVVGKYALNPELAQGLTVAGPIRETILAEFISRAGSAEFGAANTFARSLPDLESGLKAALSAQEALLLVANVYRAAEHGAWGALGIRNVRFSSTPWLRSQAIQAIDDTPEEAAGILQSAGIGMQPTVFKQQWLTDVVVDEQEE